MAERVPSVPADNHSDPERTDILFAPASDPGASGVDSPDAATLPATAITPAPAPPAFVGRFRVARELARGGMGAILVAEDPHLGRDVALKVLLEAHLRKPGYRERFLEEARVTGLLQHPGVIAVYEVGELEDTRPFFAMQLIEGQTLDAQLAARKSPADDLPRFLHVFERVCETLAFAHNRCVIHRDLKPLNVMLAPFGVVKVMDWGVAKLHIPGLDEEAEQAERDRGEGLPVFLGDTQFGSVVGTPAYMAPEQAQGDSGRIDERTDVFGLGGILCAVLTGLPPYTGTRTKRVHARAARADLAEAFARLDSSHAPRALVALAKWCLAPRPEARPANAQTVTETLTAYLESDLRQAERDLVRFFELSPDLFCIAGLDGYFHRVNENFTRVLGYTPEELISRPFIEFVHPDDRAVTQSEAEKLSRGLPVVLFRNRYRDVRGDYRWFEWEAKSIPEEGIIFAVARDITARVEMELRLRGEEGE